MGYGLLQAATDTRKDALSGMEEQARQQAEREAKNKQLQAQKKQSQQMTTGTMVATGVMIGSRFGPWGAVIGGAAGLLGGLAMSH